MLSPFEIMAGNSGIPIKHNAEVIETGPFL